MAVQRYTSPRLARRGTAIFTGIVTSAAGAPAAEPVAEIPLGRRSLRTHPELMRPIALLLLAGLVLLGCPRERAREARIDLVGTWEVLDEPHLVVPNEAASRRPLTVRQRYIFAADSTLQIYRPAALGLVSRIFAVFDFHGDTLVVRSEFDSGYYLPRIARDTLFLVPVHTGRPLTLVRVADEAPVAPPPPPNAEGDYTPPPALPPDEMPQS